jgi:hypothetical protein
MHFETREREKWMEGALVLLRRALLNALICVGEFEMGWNS